MYVCEYIYIVMYVYIYIYIYTYSRGRLFILIFSTKTNSENMIYLFVRSEKCPARGIRKATTGMAVLWQPRVLCDVAFWSFDVVASYHWGADIPKCENQVHGLPHVFFEMFSWGVRKVTTGTLACGSQAFFATFLFDPSMLTLPITGTQKSQSAKTMFIC